MSALSPEALWRRLSDNALVQGPMPAAQEPDSPWFIRVLQGLAGWIGALFLFGFVAAGFLQVMQSGLAALGVGALSCAAAAAVFRFRSRDDFSCQFGQALSLAGQGLIIYGLFNLFPGRDSLCLGAAFLIEACLCLLLPNFISRVITSMAASLALTLSLYSMGLYGLSSGLLAAAFALIWIRDGQRVRWQELLRPAGYGLALTLLGQSAWSLRGVRFYGFGIRPQGDLFGPWAGKALVAAAFLWVVVLLLKRLRIPPGDRRFSSALSGATLAMAAAIVAPGIAQALLVLLLGFALCNRLLLGMGMAAFGAFLSSYYYLMESTLLFKAALLFGLGAALLLSRLLLRLWLCPKAAGGTRHA